MTEVDGDVKWECMGSGDGGLSVSIAKTMSTLISGEGLKLWGVGGGYWELKLFYFYFYLFPSTSGGSRRRIFIISVPLFSFR